MPHFVMISDQNYATVLHVGLRKIQQFYPESRVFLYDWGLKHETKSVFQDEIKHLTIVDWTEEIRRIRNRMTDRISRTLLSLVNKAGWVDRHVFERLLMEKPTCFRHCSDLAGDEMLFFLDADVVLLDRLDEITQSEFDIIFTLRRESEFEFTKDSCQVINSGVIFFGNDQIKRNKFLDHWIKRARQSREYLREQSTLTRMFEEHGRSVFRQYSSFDHDIDGTEIAVKLYPCEIFNFNWIEEAVEDPSMLDDIKLLHFKGRRHDPTKFKDLMSGLRMT